MPLQSQTLSNPFQFLSMTLWPAVLTIFQYEYVELRGAKVMLH